MMEPFDWSNLVFDVVDTSLKEGNDGASVCTLPKMRKDLSLTNESFKTPIIMPRKTPFTDLQYKDADRAHKTFLNLLHPKPNTILKKSFPKTREQKKNTTIPEKLTEVYLKSLKRNTMMKEKNCMKNDFLEELVIKEDLKYLTLEILSRDKCFILIDYERKPIVLEGTLYNDIQNEMLSVPLYKALSKMMSEHKANINDYLFDYHIILNVKRYLSHAPKAEPVFSCFMLLKPTNELLIKFAKTPKDHENNKPPDHENNKPPVPDLESLRKESKIFYKLSGPLYLETSPLAKQFMNFLREHQHRFDSDVFSQEPLKKDENLNLNVNLPLLYENVMQSYSGVQKFYQLLQSPMGLPFEIKGTVIESPEDWRKQFKELLEKRDFEPIKKKPLKRGEIQIKPLDKYELFEIFSLKFTINSNDKIVPVERYISVFYHPDGSFKFCTTVRLFQTYVPRYPDALFMTNDDKKFLDRYIFQVVSILNQISSCGIQIYYSNFQSQITWELFTHDDKIVKEMNKKPSLSACIYQNDAFLDSKHKKYLNAVGYDEDAEIDYFVRQQVLINGCIRDLLLRHLKKPYVLDVYSQIDEQKYTKKPEDLDFPATCVLENGNQRSAFEAHKFEKSYRYRYETKGENDEEIRNEFYPSLLRKYNCSKNDFRDGHQFVFTDDVKNFLELCSKGEVRPHYLNSERYRS